MISGPTPPHPRLILKALLDPAYEGKGSAAAIESGLCLLEEDVRVGDDLRVDFLARDAAGMPVLILAVDAEDEAWAPLHIVDLEIWFRENAYLLEQAVAPGEVSKALSWSRGFRIVVVALNVPDRFYRRLELLRGIEMDVYELRSVFVRGETRWLLRAASQWDATVDDTLPTIPRGLEDLELGELGSNLLDRASTLAEDIEIRGDRFERDLRWMGRSLLSLEVRDGKLQARVAPNGVVFEIRTPSDVDRVLDKCLRAILSEDVPRAPASGRSNSGSYLRIASGPRLSDEEVSAFYENSASQ